MSFVQALRSRREAARNRLVINQAIARAATPAMRDELIIAAQRTNYSR